MMARILFAALLVFCCSSLLPKHPDVQADEKKVIVFLAGTPSHGYGAHEHYAGCKLLARTVESGISDCETVVVQDGWPNDESVFENAVAIVMYADGGARHPAIPHLKMIDEMASRGVGIVCLHYGVEVPAGEPGEHFLKWIGGYFEANWSVNPHWTAEFKQLPVHPITNGVKPFSMNDEWYYHMRFRDGMKNVTPILTALPGEETLVRPDGPHSGNPGVRAAVLDRKESQHVAWASENESGGRGFGFTGGHYHWNWADPNFTKLVANAIVWSAQFRVPENGIATESFTVNELDDDQDYERPADFKPQEISERLSILVGEEIKELELSAARKRLSSKKRVRKPAVRLKSKSETGKAAPIAVAPNIDAPKEESMKSDGSIKQTAKEKEIAAARGKKKKLSGEMEQVRKKNQPRRSPEQAIAGLEVVTGLEVKLFAAEPQLLSLSNCDVDHLGRVWACEIVNYRQHKGKRPEGDRILICDDRNGDGVADDVTVFYQGTEIDSPHGVCVLPTPDGRGTRAIVSAKDKVWMLSDADGDGRADNKRVMFTGIGGTQHDHGIHAFVFGPDGRLYFNFGNEGKQIKDAKGKPIVDKAGNEVNNSRQPYQEGMVFRCDMDGGNFETLGWNFRNSWEVCVDSFGNLWQSDNDDDGNKSVRINYVMEFGNYGYKDVLTGAGWQQQRIGWHDEIPMRHWHLNDPGSVPSLLHTGAGSPAGILFYEGELLPKKFRNQLIHCDPGPNVVRAYPVQADGAGYKADSNNILLGTRDKWFRPADVCVAPDGSLIIADWYDPGVGGHAMGDLERGRLFRIAPPNKSYIMPSFDYSTAEGAAEALRNPCQAVRYMAWNALHNMGTEAEGALQDLYFDTDNRVRARALWLLAQIEGRQRQYVEMALVDGDPDIRIVGLRLARMFDFEMLPIVRQMLDEESPRVRRELAIALRGFTGKPAARTWAKLAAKHNGKDRWYLEALGIGAESNWDESINAYLNEAGIHPERAGWRDVVWRSRAKETSNLLVKIFATDNVGSEEDRYMRAFEFQADEERDAALEKLLEMELAE